jgi:rfaE bifunctional protein kinase chain/domain
MTESDSLLRERCRVELRNARACIVSDYAKGVASEEFCRWLIAEAASFGIPVIVDPKARDLARYRGATVVTPNLKETSAASGIGIESPTELTRAVAALLPSISPSSLLVTRGEDGMSLYEPGRAGRHLPALRNEVADVTGAGDTVVATLALALGAGFDLFDAACLANIAAAIAVSHHGTWAVNRDEMAQAAAQLDISVLAAAEEA